MELNLIILSYNIQITLNDIVKNSARKIYSTQLTTEHYNIQQIKFLLVYYNFNRKYMNIPYAVVRRNKNHVTCQLAKHREVPHSIESKIDRVVVTSRDLK